jgi:hypothetical protein
VLNVGNFAALDQLPEKLAQDPLNTAPRLSPIVPFNLPGFTLNSLTVKAFNAAVYMLHRDSAAHNIFDWDSFFYPLDSITTGIESMASAASCSTNACGRPRRAAPALSKCSKRSPAAGARRFSRC